MLDQCCGSEHSTPPPGTVLHPLTCDAGDEARDGEQQRGAGSHGHAGVMGHDVTRL